MVTLLVLNQTFSKILQSSKIIWIPEMSIFDSHCVKTETVAPIKTKTVRFILD